MAKAPPKFTTLLASVRSNHLAVTCNCGHSALISIGELAAQYPALRICDVLERLRCTSCKAKGGLDARIVYRGESDIAMLGAAQNKAPTGRA